MSDHASMAAVMAALETALRAEVKKLREENTELRREAIRAKALQDELSILRNVTLTQHDEKVPIRLRELEQDNLRLRKTNASLEEKLRTFESDEFRQRLLDHHNLFGSGKSTGLAWTDASSPSPAQQSAAPPTAAAAQQSPLSSATTQPGRVVVIKQGDPCASCKLRVNVTAQAHQAEMKDLKERLAKTQAHAAALEQELLGVQRWLQPLVAGIQAFPLQAHSQPIQTLHSFASPTRYTSDVQTGAQLLGGSFDISSIRR
jgi:hypothetical protein